MSLYDDDIDTDKTNASGWASGIKLMHNQLAFKKATVTAPKRDSTRKTSSKLAPVIDLKSRRDDDENIPPTQFFPIGRSEKDVMKTPPSSSYISSSDPEWKFSNEYDPVWPNDYEKVVKEMRDRRDKEEEEKRRWEREERDKKRRESRSNMNRIEETPSGFSKKHEIEEEETEERPRRAGGHGAAIAPPASLDQFSEVSLPMPVGKPSTGFGGIGGSIAAKIMAKYGFKEGQGLGKSQQGIVRALEVEKTSKRGGRIVSEADEGCVSPPPAPTQLGAFMPPPPPTCVSPMPSTGNPAEAVQNIAVILKNPSKVSLLRNMVGPGEVDDDLEPEVREECSSKYGPVAQVVIFEIPRAVPEEAVRIFVEFQRVEAAIKAVIDLNGRFFGGRQVKAGFYDVSNFKAYKLNEPV